jgi:hypothetical protein
MIKMEKVDYKHRLETLAIRDMNGEEGAFNTMVYWLHKYEDKYGNDKYLESFRKEYIVKR